MPHFFLLLLKINLVLILFSATYYLVLRRLTFYSINRVFLLFGIVFSSAYPFINLTDFFAGYKAVPAFVPEFNRRVSHFVRQEAVPLIWQLLILLFYVGVILMALRLLVQFISLYRMHKNSSPDRLNHYPVRILADRVSPFSFWQTIYINPDLHKKEDLANILAHEQVHVTQWHTLDIILAEVCVVFYWFNPGVWLMKKAVRENIEFITDASILKKGIDKKAYQYSLLDVGTLQPSVAIVNNFSLSDLKKRIKMMNTKRSSKLNLTRYGLVLPVLLCITLAFTIDKKTVEKSLAPLTKMVAQAVPQKLPEPVVEVKPTIKVNKRKKAAILLDNTTDTGSKMTFVIKTIAKVADSSQHQMEDMLKTLSAKVNLDAKTNGSVKRITFVKHFTFTDSIPSDEKMKQIVLSADQITDGGKVADGKKRKITTVFVVNSTASFNDAGDQKNTVKDVVMKNISYYVDGKMINSGDIDKLNPNVISNIKVDKNSQAIRISTKP